MTAAIVVESLYRYPVKSMQGSTVESIEVTTSGVSGYHLNTSSTTSAGFAEAGRPTRSDSACSGFIQKRDPSRNPTGSTSSVCATKVADHGSEEIGPPICSANSKASASSARQLCSDCEVQV